MMALIPTDGPTKMGEGLWDDDGEHGVGARDPVPHSSQPVEEVVSRTPGIVFSK
jgi:hypothetical protein